MHAVPKADETMTDTAPLVERRRDSGWRDPRFWIGLVGLVVTLSAGAWAVARNVAIMSNNVTEMRSQLQGIDAKLTALTIADSTQQQELRYIRTELDKLRVDWKADKDLQDTYIQNTREKLIQLEARSR